MTMTRFIRADQARVHHREDGHLIEIPADDDPAVVVEWRCDVGVACDASPRPRIEHQLTMTVDGPGYPETKVGFAACVACCQLVVPNSVRVMLATFGVDLPPGLQPDR